MNARRSLPNTPIISAGVIPVYGVKDPEFLLLRVYRYWDFPKGVVEKKEEPFAAARRELQEETGLAQVSFPWGSDYFQTEPYSYGKVARYYLGKVESRAVALVPNPVTGLVEHHEFRWFKAADARSRLVPRVAEALDWALDRLQGHSREAGAG
ncbi:MAG: NUDIX domain-containing protein [Proteobacteria bacterium]|nr:MAG: NUDIX domain-containing protein [Pseudomonadota bacterium]